MFLGCPSSGPVPPVKEPLRPKVKTQRIGDINPDCVQEFVMDRAVPYSKRKVSEARGLAKGGSQSLKQVGVPKNTEAEKVYEESVESLIEALSVDPYNVLATYELAAAYAQIKRASCATNLLARLLPLMKLPTKEKEAKSKVDALLGRGSVADKRFDPIRRKGAFRSLMKKFK